MDFNQIDVLDRGTVWQGGHVDADIESLPGPVLIVCMDRGESNEQWITHGPVEAVLAVWIDDDPTATLKPDVLLGLIKMAASWLDAGGNIYVHCAHGVSRASYFDVALHMYVLKLPYQEALDRIRERRAIADPNPGFAAQLQQLQARLTA